MPRKRRRCRTAWLWRGGRFEGVRVLGDSRNPAKVRVSVYIPGVQPRWSAPRLVNRRDVRGLDPNA